MSGAVAALERGEETVVGMIDEFRARRDLVLEELARLPGVSCVSPAGAFYVFPDFSSHYGPGEGSMELVDYLLEEARVAVVPGVAFGHDNHIRISFTSPQEVLREGIARIEAALVKQGRKRQESTCNA